MAEKYQDTRLKISGYQDVPVPNLFIRQAQDTHTLAITFPGLHYSCDKPLLYYPSKLILERGGDILQLQTDYTRPDFQFAPRQEQVNWIFRDAQSALLAGCHQRQYEKLILIGKSIGTLALAGSLSADFDIDVATVWITPLLYQPPVVDAARSFDGPALFLVGTGDPTYIPDVLQQIQESTGAEVLVVKDANHSLEIPGDTFRSLAIIEDILLVISRFLDEI